MVEVYNIVKNVVAIPTDYKTRYQDIEVDKSKQIGIYFRQGLNLRELDGGYVYLELPMTVQIQTDLNVSYSDGENIAWSFVDSLDGFKVETSTLSILSIDLNGMPLCIGRSKSMIPIYTVNFTIRLNRK